MLESCVLIGSIKSAGLDFFSLALELSANPSLIERASPNPAPRVLSNPPLQLSSAESLKLVRSDSRLSH